MKKLFFLIIVALLSISAPSWATFLEVPIEGTIDGELAEFVARDVKLSGHALCGRDYRVIPEDMMMFQRKVEELLAE